MSETSKNKTTQVQRFTTHPLVQYDPEAAKWIKVIKAEYFEDENTKPPVPRNQDLPPHAFGNLTERTILAATSHAWFWQCHPDPEGVKLKLLREDFIPRLRKRYPDTKIVIFDDWHSCPQWPRTKKEEQIFYKCMDRMNSMYVYCDIVLFMEAKLPDLDMTVRMCTLVPSNYAFGRFVDVTQFHGPESSSLEIKKNDIVVKPSEIDVLKTTTHKMEISYLKRPFGRPNRVHPNERGWLYAERVTIAVKLAMAGEHQFDEILWSNSEEVRSQILTWTHRLLKAAKDSEIRMVLYGFKMQLDNKKFTRDNDRKLVEELVQNLVSKFSTNWTQETKRQKSMSTRVCDILLRWGEFSTKFVKESYIVKQDVEEPHWMWRSVGILFCLCVAVPILACIPVTLTRPDDCIDGFFAYIMWLSLVSNIGQISALPSNARFFVGVP